MDRKAFLNRQRIGVVMRTFAKKEEDVPRRVEAVRAAAIRIRLTKNFPVARIDVLVPEDARYVDHDCGKTVSALREKVEGDDLLRAQVHAFERGDQFCALLNHAVAMQSRDRIDWTLILSTELSASVTEPDILAMIDAACAGAKAVGLAFEELEQTILEGRLANTCCLWHNASLQTVGGFDFRAAQVRTDDRIASHMRGWNEKDGEQFYPLHGVEEVIPLARMVDLYGPCIAPILPAGTARYQAPDPTTEPEKYARHVKKMGTKMERQMAMLAQVGYDLSWLKGGVMKQYR